MKKIKLKKSEQITLAATGLGVLFLAFTIFFLRQTSYFETVAILAIIATGMPFVVTQYLAYKKSKEIEEYLPDFLRDVAESIRAGMPLTKALENATHGTYGGLSGEMKITSAQISWGVPFEEAMRRFAKRVKSRLVRQAVLIIIEAHKSGGEIADVLETVSTDIKTLKSIEQERKSKLKVYLVSMYFIFFLFLGIIVTLTQSFIPATPQLNEAAGILGGNPSSVSEEDFKQFFFHLCIIQAFFAGLIGGQMGEGSAVSGIKHSIFLVLVTIVIFQFLLPTATLEQKIGGVIIRTPITASKMESSTTPFTIFKTTTSNDVIEEIKRQAGDAERLEPYTRIKASQITFEAEINCPPCERGDISVSESSVVVNKQSRITYAMLMTGQGTYKIIIGGP